MTAPVKTIFVKGLTALVGAVSVVLTANGAKTVKYNAVVTDTAGSYTVYGTDGKIKVFADAAAVTKFVGKFMEQGLTIDVNMPSDALAPKAVASTDPTKEIASEQAALNKDITAADAVLTKNQALAASATSLGWATGNSAEQAALQGYNDVITLVTAYVASLNAKLASLTPGGGAP
ncbi:hypothetical protein [Collimonas pratensis]|uniref:Uncharacterized protein n=1 Tax=Collimonas pratensis TaxID=279113 RepID=A0ABN4ME93_9BURK|nr:hypothetical protein [Collimonas pratensis]AMP14884.1 hypothetical protein CPter291_2627 [Collimonas pratensis]